MTNTSMHDYARMGAVARLAEIQIEVAAIRGAFPELAGQDRRAPKAKARQPKARGSAAPEPRRKMSTAARKAISAAQKKRWAAQRAMAVATVS